MSQENVEIVKAAFEAWNAGDMDALREHFDPGAILHLPEGWPEPGPFVGRGVHAPVAADARDLGWRRL
jgi:ketosteroid isomerase-like protein